MIRTGSIAVLTLSAFLVTGCASVGGSRGGDPNWVCVIVGGLIGGGAGVVASNSNHGEDDDDDARRGAAIGALVGGVIGHYVCRDRTVVAEPAPAPPPAPRAVPEPEKPAPAARRIVLRGIGFAFDSARIEPEFEPVLDVAVDELKANPGVSVEVSGHTDATGPDAYNQSLSERRANSVVQYLVGKGISAGRLAAVGHGESQPVADNATRDGRAQNRRVELNVK